MPQAGAEALAAADANYYLGTLAIKDNDHKLALKYLQVATETRSTRTRGSTLGERTSLKRTSRPPRRP